MLQADEPDTFVLATNRTETVRDFVTMAFKAAGIDRGLGGRERGGDRPLPATPARPLVRVNPKFYRPAEVDLLIGDPAQGAGELGWEPKTTLEQLCPMMVEADMKRNERGVTF